MIDINPDSVSLDELNHDHQNMQPSIFDHFEDEPEYIGDNQEVSFVTGGTFKVENDNAS